MGKETKDIPRTRMNGKCPPRESALRKPGSSSGSQGSRVTFAPKSVTKTHLKGEKVKVGPEVNSEGRWCEEERC